MRSRATSMDSALLKVEDLSVHFPVTRGVLRRTVGACKAVDGVSFALHRGEVLGVVGESGCGKSTLARAAVRLIEPTGGKIWFDGCDLRRLNRIHLRRWRPKAQLVFQDPFASLNPRQTVAENIVGGARFHGLAVEERKLLDQVGLPITALEKFPHEFSGGQQQRICIARALAMQPELLICDEAVSALDVSVQAQILELLAELKQSLNVAILFISHDLSVVRSLCDRVLVLYLGKVVEMGPTQALYDDPRHPYTQALLAAIPAQHPDEVSPRLRLQGELPSPINPPSGCPFHPRCPIAIPDCAKQLAPHCQNGSEHHWWCQVD